MPQFNQMSLKDTYGAGLKDKQNREFNALRMEAGQQSLAQGAKQFDDAQRLKNTKLLAGWGKYGQGLEDPEELRLFAERVDQEAQRLGIVQASMLGQVDTNNPDALREGFRNMEIAGMAGLGGGYEQEEAKLVKDAAGYQRYGSGPNFGERAFPDVEEPERASFGTTGSLQEVNAINAYRVEQGQEPLDPEEYLASRRQTSADLQRYNQYLSQVQRDGGTPMSEQDYAATRAGTIAGQTREDSGEADRIQKIITQGQEVADGLPVLRRSRELLDVVATGGVLREAQLAFAKSLGIETADQGEISANLGKAVLSQLRETFGAQFTQEEGNRLIAIEAGFGKNNETNRRLLGQAIAIVEAKARRAVKLARSNDDEATAQVIEEMMEMSLSTDDTSAVWKYDSEGNRIQ